MINKIILLIAFTSICYLAPTTQASEQDHSLLSKMPGYKIESHKIVETGNYGLNEKFYCQEEGKLCSSAVPGFDDSGILIAQGKVTKIRYVSKQPAGTRQVFSNYDSAVRALGGRRLNYTSSPINIHVFMVQSNAQKIWIVLSNYVDDAYELTFIEEKQMTQVVKAGQLADSIANQGFATLYINFDNNKTDIKPDARFALDEVVAMLKKDTTLRIAVEGHTDNAGSAAANKTLSQGRAQSVVQALVASGIDAKRLMAKGMGSESPIADNRSDEGKAKNRRVELVKLK
jgi:OmpA-OmpF porin, OOP family